MVVLFCNWVPLLPLQLNFNSATKEYLERYVGKKRENFKNSEAVGSVGVQEAEKEEGSATGSEKGGSSETTKEEPKEEKITDEKDEDITKFGLVTNDDKEADREALEKLNGIIEERLKTHPLPPPPPPPPPPMATAGSGTSNTEVQDGAKEENSDVDIVRSGKSLL